MNDCPCCSAQLLRHVGHNRVYWFCPHCRQEMPVLATVVSEFHQEFQLLQPLNKILSKPISVTIK